MTHAEQGLAQHDQHLSWTIEPEYAGALARTLQALDLRPGDGAPVTWSFAPGAATSGVPVEFESQVPLSDGGTARLQLRGLGQPEKAGSTARLLEVTLTVPRERLEVAQAFMHTVIARFGEERRMECRGADHFLGNPAEVAWRKRSWPSWRMVALHRALDECLQDWTRVRVGSPRGREPVRRTFVDEEGQRTSLYTDARYFLRRGEAWMVLDLHSGSGNAVEVEVSAAAVGLPEDELDGLHDRLAAAINRGPTSVRRMTAHGDELRLERDFRWNELFLHPSVLDDLRLEIERFFSRRELYQKMQLPYRRGLLLHGPPGTGKTLFGKILASSVRDAAFVWVTAADVTGGAGAIRSVFERARACHRAILFFEDLDFYAAHRGRSGRDDSLGELLVQLDGMNSNDGLFVIATTNDLEAIEPALRDRPSRFDRTIEVGAAPAEVRLAHLLHLLEPFGVQQETVAPLAGPTEGLVGAQLQELALVARRNALEHGREHVTAEDLEQALAAARSFKSKIVGFGPPAPATFVSCSRSRD